MTMSVTIQSLKNLLVSSSEVILWSGTWSFINQETSDGWILWWDCFPKSLWEVSCVISHPSVIVPRVPATLNLALSNLNVEDGHEKKRGDTKDHPLRQWLTKFFEADELWKLVEARVSKIILWSWEGDWEPLGLWWFGKTCGRYCGQPIHPGSNPSTTQRLCPWRFTYSDSGAWCIASCSQRWISRCTKADPKTLIKEVPFQKK